MAMAKSGLRPWPAGLDSTPMPQVEKLRDLCLNVQ
jgi:hypothetical protein